MKEKFLLETAVDDIKVRLCHFDNKTEQLTIITAGEADKGAKLFNCSEDLVDALTYLCEQINEMRDAVKQDLTDLYKETKNR